MDCSVSPKVCSSCGLSGDQKVVEGVKTFKAARTLLEKHGVKLRKVDFQVGGQGAWENRLADPEVKQLWPIGGQITTKVSCSFSV